MRPLWVLRLGRREYGETWELQKRLCERRQRDEIADTLVLVEHPDTITLGRRPQAAQHVLSAGEIPVFEIERGGDVTYHGPGQLVGYPIFKLEAQERDLHRYLRNLEESLIRSVRLLGLDADRNEGLTGVWASGRKIASIGVAVRKWVTLHGF